MEREGDLLAAKSYLSTILITVILFWLNVSLFPLCQEKKIHMFNKMSQICRLPFCCCTVIVVSIDSSHRTD